MSSPLVTRVIIVAAIAAAATATAASAQEVTIDTTLQAPSCTRKAANGDKVYVHYEGTLMDGTKFDASYDRGKPLSFNLGSGMVIKGWEIGILGMCKGEKRDLTIPYALAYGEAGMPPTIPAKADLKFKVELMGIGEYSGAEDHSESGGEGEDYSEYDQQDYDHGEFDDDYDYDYDDEEDL